MKNLTRKLCEIMSEINEVEKTGYNTHNKYAYVTEAELMRVVRPKLAEKGIFIFKSVEDMTKEENLTSIKVKYTFCDSESGETFEVYGHGQGADKQDKGYGKADTNAYKYFLLKNFLISTEDDPENDNIQAQKENSNLTTKRAGPAPGPKKAGPVAAKGPAAAPKAAPQGFAKPVAAKPPTVTKPALAAAPAPTKSAFGQPTGNVVKSTFGSNPKAAPPPPPPADYDDSDTFEDAAPETEVQETF
jgi:hypothetical protein